MGNPYSDLNLDRHRSFFIEGQFSTTTITGLKVAYQLKVNAKLISRDDYRKTKMADDASRQSALERFNEKIVQQFFNARNVFFHLDWRKAAAAENPVGMYEFRMSSDGHQVKEIELSAANKELIQLPSVTINGCELRVMNFSAYYPSPGLIISNSAMITDEQRQAIQTQPGFSEDSERLAVALLEKRLSPETANALKEIGHYVQFNTAVEEAERSAMTQIESENLSDVEKAEKIERLKEAVTLIRERHEEI